MDAKRSEYIHKINYLTFETDSVYHQASLRLGVSDCVSMILYTLYDLGEECLLSDLYKKSGTSKQTVNSALRKLETEDILFLKQHTGRAKKVCLTEKGREYTRQTAGRLFFDPQKCAVKHAAYARVGIPLGLCAAADVLKTHSGLYRIVKPMLEPLCRVGELRQLLYGAALQYGRHGAVEP